MPSKTMPMIAKRLEFFNSVTDNQATMYLYGTIGAGWYADINSEAVRSQLEQITADTIHVHIHSGGGDVFESIAIQNLFKAHPAKIMMHVDGLAGSGASVIAMAGDEIHMPSNTMMMIHKAATFLYGNAEKLRKQATVLDKIDQSVTASYMGRFVGAANELDILLCNEEWLTAEDCQALGFCDVIGAAIDMTESEPEEKPALEEETVASIVGKYSANQRNKPPSTPQAGLSKTAKQNTILNIIGRFNQ
ncbi:head maturation protease, ClpP-related [Listeria booriae]|uniref:head maturation protease, ClpP-related n=1 Tax=Listeria booriae TaxID=1552123 RepID=UPI00162435FE|nr:head maturation protease, ClpP-related [Listeria booriae]MBC1247342.1 Clp protease ClpP [Listeria booriae]